MQEWLNGLNSLGTTAGGIIGAIRGDKKPAPVVAARPTNWKPLLLIGGGLLVVALVLPMLLRRGK